jgi:hypothetical protein
MSNKTKDEKSKKWIYYFSSKDGEGKEYTFMIKKPNRKLREDGEIYHAAQVSHFIEAGILPRAVLETIMADKGGTISTEDEKRYAELFVEFREKTLEFQKISLTKEDKKTAAQKSEEKYLNNRLDEIREELQKFQMNQIMLYENCAESKARNRAIMWWLMMLSFVKDGTIDSDSKEKEVFAGEDINAKLDYYDELSDSEEEKDKFLVEAIKKLSHLITVWYIGGTTDFDEFEESAARFDKTTEEIESEEAAKPLAIEDGEKPKAVSEATEAEASS